MIYLMAPYSSPLAAERIARVQLITLILGELMQQFPYDWIFSPITQGHHTVPYLPPWIAEDHGFWMQQCEHAVRDADRILLFPLPGWKQSRGIARELDWCEEQDKPVVLVDAKYWLESYLQMHPDFKELAFHGWSLAHDYLNQHKALYQTEMPSLIMQRYCLSRKGILVHTERSEQE